ncbi:MAG: hypothetical protein F6K47_08505 [Symploca sp. SIO2E6]|nr:hypothetical protein [Symploca sp. SIO2E6]
MEIIIVFGELGGIGKSTVTKALGDYHHERGIDCIIFDTDRSNADVWRAFGGEFHQLAIFSEAKRFQDAANSIFNAAFEKRVLVNTPAQVMPSLKDWIEKNALLELAEEEGIIFVMVFVTNGELDSLSLLKKTLDYFGNRVQHVIVKNYGVVKSEDEGIAWRAFEQDKELQQLITKVGAKVINFPAFYGDTELAEIESKSLSFRNALTHDDFGLISRKRVHKFLQKAYSTFDEAGVFHQQEFSADDA